MNQFLLIEVNAATAFERGVQYGSQAKELIRTSIAYYRKKFERSGHSWETVLKYALDYVPVIEEAMPEILEEARGIAAGAECDFAELMAVNCRYEITKFPKIPECTTAAVLPEASVGGKTYAIKNWDFFGGVMEHLVLLHIKTPEYSALGWAEAGQMMREGFNSNGVAICNNALTSLYDYAGSGIPVTFLRRRVLAAKSFEEARDLILHAKRCVSNNILLVGAKGQVMNAEVTPNKVYCINSTGGIITHANHFVVDPSIDAVTGKPKNRDRRLMELLSAKRGEIDVAYIKECMRDHEYHPFGICRHPDKVTDESMTVASMIVDFEANEAHICFGPPCENAYKVYKL